MATPSLDVLSSALQQFKQLTKKPDRFLSTQNNDSRQIQAYTKSLYDTVKESERTSKIADSDALPTLIVENFDEEQIWQQLELQNNSVVDNLLASIASVSTSADVSFKLKNSKHQKSGEHQKSRTAKGELSCDKGVCIRNTVSDKTSNKEKRKKDIVDNDDKYIIRNNADKLSKDYLKEKVLESPLESEDDVDTDGLSDDIRGGDHEKSDESESEKELLEVKARLGDAEGSDAGSEDDLDFDFGDLDAANEKSDGDDLSSDESDNEIKRKNGNEKKSKPSIVDDEFFKLSEMENFLDQQDALEMKKDEGRDKDDDDDDDDVNIFSDLESSDDDAIRSKSARKMKYKDYFLGEKTKPTREETVSTGVGDDNNEDDVGDEDEASKDEGEESEGEEVGDILGGRKTSQGVKSSFEIRQEKLKERISEMEEASLSTKPWQLSGEVQGFKRPENSLLAETVQFEHTTRLPPVITEETTQNLEGIITQRIKDKAWDDVERRVKSDDTAGEYKKRITLDQEKSKQSLGEIYEQEYLRQQQTEEQDKKDPDHEKIKKSMRELFIKLDALSNFHFTPKPAAPDLVIISNQPSIAMEEVAPVSVSDAHLLAPEEIHDKKKGELKGNTEKSRTDRKRERRNKKTEKRAKIREKEKRQKVVEKLNPGLGNKYSKERAMRELERQGKGDGSVTLIKKSGGKKSMSSKTFFTELQGEVTAQQRKRTAQQSRDKNVGKSAKKFKL